VNDLDRLHWDARHSAVGPAPAVGLPPLFAPFERYVPERGFALDLACGRGRLAVWLADRGLDVLAVDISPVAIELAKDLATRHGVQEHCRFEITDLDGGLPPTEPAALIACHLFRNPALDRPIIERLAPGGRLAIAVLSEVGSTAGRFRAHAGELEDAFSELCILSSGEADGYAWLFAERLA
jgi:SAM-dependent methyltransferase